MSSKKRKAGRPRIGIARLNLTIDKATANQLDEIQEAYGATSLGEVVRMAVRFYYKHGDWWPEVLPKDKETT